MKSFKEFFVENNYQIGSSVVFDMQKLGARMDISIVGGFDYGKIIEKGNGTYKLQLPNNNELVVNADEIISYGDAGPDVA